MSITPIVTADEVALRMGLPTPLSEQDRLRVEAAIVDAQTDLEGYLGRPVTPRDYTETGLFPYPQGFQLRHQPVISVISQTPELNPVGDYETGLYTVVYTAGLDGVADPDLEPLRRYVRTHAIYSPELQEMLRKLTPEATRVMRSSSVEGQSVTYEDAYTPAGEPGSGAPGSLPTLASCDRWRLRSVYQRPSRPGWWHWPHGRGW